MIDTIRITTKSVLLALLALVLATTTCLSVSTQTAFAATVDYEEAYAKGVAGFWDYIGAGDVADLIEGISDGTFGTNAASTAETDYTSTTAAGNLDNFAVVLDMIEYLNDYRESVGLSELTVSAYLLAVSVAAADYADDYYGVSNPHQVASDNNVGENLAWNSTTYTQAFVQWIDNEKAYFDAYCEAVGAGTLTGANAYNYYQSNKSAIDSWVTTKYGASASVGHYINIINPNYKYTGAGYATKDSANTGYGANWNMYEQSFSSTTSSTSNVVKYGTYTVSELREKYEEYLESIGYLTTTELAGATRYDTMAAIVSAGFESSDAVILATGDTFPDSLAASGLAGYLNAPIVLTGSDPTQAIETISALGAETIYVLGGENSISESVLSQITSETGATAERIAGAGRQETALAINEFMTEKLGAEPEVAIIAYSEKYADALSISSYAYVTGASIFLTQSDGTLSDAVIKAIQDGNYKTILILGKESSVSSSVDALFPDATRLGGSDRYETSVIIAEYTVDNSELSFETVTIATGENFPDALAGGPFCGVNNSVLLLANEGSQTVFDLIAENADSVSKIYFLGGEKTVSLATRESVIAAVTG